MERRIPKAHFVHPEDHPAPETGWKARDVIQAVRGHLLKDIYNVAAFEEMELEPHHEDEKFHRRADLLTIFPSGVHPNCIFVKRRQYDKHERYPFKALPEGWRTGYEIKVNRQDLLNDIKQRWKQKPLAKLCNEIYLVYPRGCINRKIIRRPSVVGKDQYWEQELSDIDLPWGMGAIEVWRDERPQWKGTLRAGIVKLARYNMQAETPAWFLNRILLYRGKYP